MIITASPEGDQAGRLRRWFAARADGRTTEADLADVGRRIAERGDTW
jgi:hypothetical protein